MTLRRGTQATISLAAAVVVAAGIRFASALLVPFLLALLIATVTAPLVFWLRQRRVPVLLAVALALFVDMLVLGGMTTMIGGSLTAFYQSLPRYQAQLNELITSTTVWLAAHGVPVRGGLDQVLEPDMMMSLVAALLRNLAGLVSQSVLVLLIVAFLLLEVTHLGPKLRRVIDDVQDLQLAAGIATEAQKYVLVKTGTSLATGVLAGFACFAFGLDLPVLWGLLAFLLNYIPSIGSIIASLPPVMLALVLHGPGAALGLAGVYLTINMVIGNMIEPKVMGDALGLSPLVVFLSVVIWGWLLGPVGALLSAPLTMLVKRWVAHTEDWAWIAILLGPAKDATRDQVARHYRKSDPDSGGQGAADAPPTQGSELSPQHGATSEHAGDSAASEHPGGTAASEPAPGGTPKGSPAEPS